jgi:TonB family protein
MRHFIAVISLIFMFVIASSQLAHAKIPAEVMEPYKAYAAAKEKGDEKATYENAKEAWEMAEKLMGANKTTGDLANNFAELFSVGKNPYKNYEFRRKARQRSIVLSKFYPENEIPGVEIDRRLELAELSLSLRIYKGRNRTQEGGKGTDFDEVERALKKYGLEGSTFDGDLHVLKSRFYNLRGSYKKSIEHADRAMKIYETRTDDWTSVHPYVVRLYKGDSLKAMDQPILAALEYQSVMQNLEGQIPADHPFVKNAFTSWVKTRSGLEDAGRLDEAELAGVCECWPFEDYKNKVTPLKRTPPKMPSSFARGKHSGHVIVMFDVDDSGKPTNIRAASSTSVLLEKPAIDSVKKWEFTKRGPEEAENVRKEVTNKIIFRLMDRSGNILPE